MNNENKPTIIIHDGLTGETIIRELTEEELAQQPREPSIFETLSNE
jgi:hypothetical protein